MLQLPFPLPHSIGLGDALAWVLARLGVQPRDTCSCKRRAALLNQLVTLTGFLDVKQE